MLPIRYISAKKIVNLFLISISYGISVLSKRVIVWGNPVAFSLEPTNLCNLDCKECPTNKVNTPKGMLQTKLAQQIIDKCSPSAFHVSLYFQGEPFLNAQLPKIITYAHQRKIATTVSTNAQSIDKEIAEQIVMSGLWRIIVSVDGYNQQSYESYRSGGTFSTVINTISLLAESKKRHNSKYPLIEAQCLILSTTEDHLAKIEQLVTDAGADYVKFKTAQIYEYEHGSDLMPKRSKSRYAVTPEGGYKIKSRLPNRCWRLWHTMVVNWQGVVLPCCFDKDWTFSIGSLETQPLHTIWKHRSFMRFRQSVLLQRKAISICKNCTQGLRLS